MSHFRRNYGRFTSSSANEHYQRQLTAPVNKWKKQWVTPVGLAPESSYKICKWVKQKEKAKLTGAIEVDDNTPVPDEGDEEEGEGDDQDQDQDQDQEMEEDDQEQEQADEDEGEEEEEAKIITTAAPTPAAPPISDSATTQANAAEIPKEESTIDATISKEEGVSAETEKPSTEAEPTPVAAEETEQEENHESTIPTHNPIPSNAVELHPIAPSSTETGLGEISTTEPVLEMETRPAEDAAIAEEKMDVEETEASGGEVVEEDKGLVHGEMDPPTQALEVEGAEAPKEVEKE